MKKKHANKQHSAPGQCILLHICQSCTCACIDTHIDSTHWVCRHDCELSNSGVTETKQIINLLTTETEGLQLCSSVIPSFRSLLPSSSKQNDGNNGQKPKAQTLNKNRKTKKSAEDNKLKHAQVQVAHTLIYETSCYRYCFHYGKSSKTPLTVYG